MRGYFIKTLILGFINVSKNPLLFIRKGIKVCRTKSNYLKTKRLESLGIKKNRIDIFLLSMWSLC